MKKIFLRTTFFFKPVTSFLENHIVQSFQDLYTNDLQSSSRQSLVATSRIIPLSSHSFLERDLTRAEITTAINSFKPHKSPGLDGLHPFFCQKYWNIIDNSVEDFCFAVFTHWEIPHCINNTYICLVPKSSNAATIGQCRPISLFNTIYKIITKILVNRVKPFLQDLIGPTQASFLANRRVADNAILVQEPLHYFKSSKSKKGYVMLKIDLEKAFDRLEMSLIRDTSLLQLPSQIGYTHHVLHHYHFCFYTC